MVFLPTRSRAILLFLASLLITISYLADPVFANEVVNEESSEAPSNESETATIETVRNIPWINEFHYDNLGTDKREFVEIAAPANLDISNYTLTLYNGYYGRQYVHDPVHPLAEFNKGQTIGGITFYSKIFKPLNCSTGATACGIQNGKDGFALSDDGTGRVLEFISYEGSFPAQDGVAQGMTSTDIGVMEKTTTPEGWSIAKNGIGCNRDEFLWQTSKLSTPGRENQLQTTTCEVAFINEFHYKNAGEDEGEFIEVASNTDEIDLYSIVLYDSTDGRPYDAIDLAAFQQGQTTSEGLTFYFYEFATPTLSNNEALFNNAIIPGNGSGIVLAKDGVVVEFLSYEGVFEATAGVAENMTSTPIGVSQFDTTPVGSSLQLRGEGCAPKNFQWWSIEADANIRDTRGAVNTEQDIDCQQFPFVPTEPPSIETFDDDLIYGDDDFLDDVVYVPPDKKKRSSKSRS